MPAFLAFISGFFASSAFHIALKGDVFSLGFSLLQLLCAGLTGFGAYVHYKDERKKR